MRTATAGMQDMDISETAAALKEVGYEHALAVESFNFPDPVCSAEKSYETMSKLI